MKQSLKTSALIGVLSAVCIGAQAAGTDEQATQAPAAKVPSARPGVKVFIDPVTGLLLEQPPEGAETLLPKTPLPLPEPEQVEAPDGVMVDVRGRFQTPLEATIGPDGKPVVRHPGESPSFRH